MKINENNEYFTFINVFVYFGHYFLHNKHLNIEKQFQDQGDIAQTIFLSLKKIY